jgi:hypothetical protein
MLNKRIVATAVVLCLSTSSVSHATPLAWLPSPEVLVKLALWWDGLPVVRHPARSTRSRSKVGCGIDPNGNPLCGG